MEILLQRLKDPFPTRTPGELYINGVFIGFSVEDEIREVAGQPVEEWKVKGKTAIPSGRYLVTLEHSPRFGPETITLHHVPGFEGIRIHAGNDEGDSAGCPLVGYEITREGTIAFGQTKACVANLKRNVREAIAKDDYVFINVRNPDQPERAG